VYNDDDVKTFLGVHVYIVWLVIFLLFLGIGVGFIVMKFKPAFMNMEREAIKQSHQYQESHNTALMKMYEEYNEAKKELAMYKAANNEEGDYDEVIEGTEAHMQAMIKRMKSEADKIPAHQVPQEVRDLIE